MMTDGGSLLDSDDGNAPIRIRTDNQQLWPSRHQISRWKRDFTLKALLSQARHYYRKMSNVHDGIIARKFPAAEMVWELIDSILAWTGLLIVEILVARSACFAQGMRSKDVFSVNHRMFITMTRSSLLNVPLLINAEIPKPEISIHICNWPWGRHNVIFENQQSHNDDRVIGNLGCASSIFCLLNLWIHYSSGRNFMQ
jgi:hypothetical protein